MSDTPPTPSDPVDLDCTGLKCPLPVLKARKALRAVNPGGLLRVTATDRESPRDFAHFCDATGAEMVEQSEDANGVFTYLIRKP